MLNITDDPERWWREKGQFLPPCDQMHDEASREVFKRFVLSLAKLIKEEEELFNEEIEERIDKAYERGQKDGYDNGHDEGHNKGYNEGFEEGEQSLREKIKDVL